MEELIIDKLRFLYKKIVGLAQKLLVLTREKLVFTREKLVISNTKVYSFFDGIQLWFSIFEKKLRNRTPDWVKNVFKRFVFPYLAILTIVGFTFLSNYVQAAENSDQFIPNENVNDLSPGEIAKVMTGIDPYTPLIQEDPLQVALVLKDEDYLGKPVITDTATTKIEPSSATRKSTITYTVDPGDTLSSIGWNYGLRVSTIKATNGLTSDNIRQGQTLKLPPQDVSASVLAGLKTTSASTITAFKGTFGRPTRGWNISQWFGHTSFERWHTGIDLTSRSGTTILAAASGKVVSTSRGWGGGYGNHIIISHGNGFTTLYGHLSSFTVSPGQWVNQGQQIGVMGTTGWSTGVHLHFEIRKNGSAQNPMIYL